MGSSDSRYPNVPVQRVRIRPGYDASGTATDIPINVPKTTLVLVARVVHVPRLVRGPYPVRVVGNSPSADDRGPRSTPKARHRRNLGRSRMSLFVRDTTMEFRSRVYMITPATCTTILTRKTRGGGGINVPPPPDARGTCCARARRNGYALALSKRLLRTCSTD